jgi:hypothetical protein
MAGILQFDASKLQSLLDQHGLELTWKSILVTHLQKHPHLAYVSKSEVFRSIHPLGIDLIEGLTIGEVGVLYEYSVAASDSESRKSSGQYFTPDDVAIFMAGHSSFNLFSKNGVWLDPCSGIGNLSWHLASMQTDPEQFVLERLLLSDRDSLALLIARTLFTVSFQTKRKELFLDLENRFVTFDFLSVADRGELSFGENSGLQKIPKHDYVIVNPPYLATKRDNRFETEAAGDLYAYFLENIIKTSKGFISVTPQSFTNAGKFKSLRAMLLSNFSFIRIYCFDNVPANVFKGIKFGSKNTNTSNSIRAAIMVASNRGEGKEITSLLRWTSTQRDSIFRQAENFLSTVELTESFFPKVNAAFQPLYEDLTKKNHAKLSDLVSKNGDYTLTIPSSPRYFIPALKTPVARSSMHQLSFGTEDDMNRAYLLINSSLAYWWWRVRDGGMTLSLETLLSTPLTNFALNEALLRDLEHSEVVNKVYKLNAGVNQENVKHNPDLISRLNRHVLPKWAEKLQLTHSNSELVQIKHLPKQPPIK